MSGSIYKMTVMLVVNEDIYLNVNDIVVLTDF